MEMRKSILLVAVSLLSAHTAPAADQKHKQPMNRHERGKFVAFAYTSSKKTAEGKPPVPGFTIAADPQILPMGSRVRISGAGPWSGEYRVGDVGGKIKGRKVDIFMKSDQEAIRFGRREIEVVLLPSPPQVRTASLEGSRARKIETNSNKPARILVTDASVCNRCSAE
jgi:3D (Asp-Asp-Asp) domain-containing protein